MKGLKVIETRKNEERQKRLEEIKEQLGKDSIYRHYSNYELERMGEELDRDYPEYIEEECVVLYNDTTKAVVERLSTHTLHVVDIEGLKVVHEKLDNISI